MTDVSKGLTEVQNTLTTMQTVGLAIVLCFIVILVIILCAFVAWVFSRRSNNADAQLNRQMSINEKNVEGQQAFYKEQVAALQKVNESLTNINTSSTTVNTNMTGMKTEIMTTLNELVIQGRETLVILRKSPGEHKQIQALLEQLVSASGGDKPPVPEKKATNDLAKLTFTVEPVQVPEAPLNVPEPA